MKHLAILTLHFSLLTLHSSAAVPLSWTVETTRAQPATFEAYQGETLAFEAALQSAGKPLELSGISALYWQTNGMGSAYWETTAAVNSNRLSAVWTPEMDVGAKVYNCFIGIPGTIYHAAFQLRLRPSPGALPNALPIPTPVIDFARVRVLNPPWGSGGGGGGVDTNAVRDIIRDEITPATNSLHTTLNGSIDVKRDKTDLAVYEDQFSAWTHGELPRPTFVLETDQPTWYVPTEGEPDPTPYWKWRAHDEVDYSEFRLYASTNTEGGTFVWYVDGRPQEETLHAIRVKSIDPTSDTLATSNEVAAAISANEKTGTNEQVVRGELWQDYMWLIEVENADFARLALADEEGHNIIDTYATKSEVDDKADRATTLLGYGITDATPISMISATDQTFSNAVSTVAKTVTPPPSPTLRLFDEVRQCYWIGRMVNGVINWEVE